MKNDVIAADYLVTQGPRDLIQHKDVILGISIGNLIVEIRRS